jgi:hypothetical protein
MLLLEMVRCNPDDSDDDNGVVPRTSSGIPTGLLPTQLGWSSISTTSS